MKPSPIEWRVTQEEAGLRLDQVIKRALPRLPYGLVQKAFRTGKIQVNGGRTKQPATRVAAGDEVRVFLAQPTESPRGSSSSFLSDPGFLGALKQIPDWILYEDGCLLVLNKPPGLATQAGTNTPLSLDRLLKVYAGDAYTPRVVHRLDKQTSGVIVFAKTRETAQYMADLFQEGVPQKTYWAVAVGVPDPLEGHIDRPLGKMTGESREKMSSAAGETRPALTYYKTLFTNASGDISWLELTPQTGRTHQLRVHCAESGFPLLGDGKYGGRLAHPFTQRVPLCLHARSLTFPHPEGQMVTFSAPSPAFLQDLTVAHFPALKDLVCTPGI